MLQKIRTKQPTRSAYAIQLQYYLTIVCYKYVVVKSNFNMHVKNVSPRGPMCVRFLIFSLSEHCELLFLLCFIASWT